MKTERSYQNFLDVMKADATRVVYENWLVRFREYSKRKTYDDLAKIKPEAVEDLVASWIKHLMSEKKAPKTIRTSVSAIKRFYVANRVRLNWEWVNDRLPAPMRVVNDKAYTKDQISKILDKCDERKRVCFLLLASTGMRIGALPPLKIRNLEFLPEYSFHKITVDEGSNSEYFTFCTPECSTAIKSYLQFRERSGETLKPDAPLIREQFDQTNAKVPKRTTLMTLVTILEKCMIDSGVRVNENGSGRFEVMRFHGFRKFATTTMVNSLMNAIHVDMLLGHKVGLMHVYHKPTIDVLAQDYVKAIGGLTISKEKEFLAQVKELEKKIIGEEKFQQQIDDLNRKFSNLAMDYYEKTGEPPSAHDLNPSDSGKK